MADKFYTKPHAVEMLLEAIPDLQAYDLVVEPSAGSGNIVTPLRERLRRKQRLLAFDVDPMGEGIEKRDFLKDGDVPELLKAKRALVIGNPPFGRQSSLAVSFFNRCASYPSVQTIAFVVPRSWRKESVQDRLSHEFSLLRTVPLPLDSFTFKDKDRQARCDVQVWHRQRREKRVPPQCNGRYQFVKLSKAQARPQETLVLCRVGANAGRAWLMSSSSSSTRVPSPRTHLFLQLSPFTSITSETLAQSINEMEWLHRTDTVAQPSVSKGEFIVELNRLTAM